MIRHNYKKMNNFNFIYKKENIKNATFIIKKMIEFLLKINKNLIISVL